MRATMADVARETGLTIGTVSRALNTSGKYTIASETRDRVLQAATRLGYRPNLLGRALAEGSSRLIMFVTPNPFAPYYTEINHHLSLRAAAQGYSLLAASTLPKEGTIAVNDWLFGVDGLIVCDGMPAWEGYVAEALRLKIPVVGMGASEDPFLADYVRVDLFSGERQLVAHMVEMGCKSLALLTTPGSELTDPRHRAYQQSANDLGFEPRIIRAIHQTRPEARRSVADAYRKRPFDGLVCANDLLAMGALRGLADVGVRVPEDVKLAGCDGLEESSFQLVPITTLIQPIPEMCVRAWNMLQERIEGSTVPKRLITTVAQLEIRPSTASAG